MSGPLYDPSVDPFERSIVAPLYTLADLVNRYEVDPFELRTTVDGAAHGAVAHVPAQQAIQVSSDGDAAAVAVVQTAEQYRYQAGKATHVLLSVIHGDGGQAGQIRRWGLFDDADGVYFELDGTTLYAVVRSSVSGAPVSTRVAQAAWNADRMDGTGLSGLTGALDHSRGSIYEIRFQWLGVGRIEFWVNGNLCHVVRNANLLTVPYMTSAQLPVRVEIRQSAGGPAGDFVWVCGTVLVSGGSDPPEFAFGYVMPAAVTCPTAGPDTFLFGLRLAATYNAIGNRMIAVPALLSFSAEVQRGAVVVLWNPALTAPVVAASPDSYSSSEVITSVAGVVGGTTVLRPFATSGQGVNLPLDPLFARNARRLRQGDSLVLMGRGEAGASADVRASLVWREIR